MVIDLNIPYIIKLYLDLSVLNILIINTTGSVLGVLIFAIADYRYAKIKESFLTKFKSICKYIGIKRFLFLFIVAGAGFFFFSLYGFVVILYRSKKGDAKEQ